MNTDRLFQVLSAIHPLSDGLKTAVEKEIIPLSYPKHHHLLEAPRIAEQVYFLNRGFAMSYIFHESRKQVCGFWKTGEIILSARSFFERVPSTEHIQLMENSEIFCFSYDAVQRLFDEFPEAHLIYRLFMNQYYEQCRERVHDIKMLSAAQRQKKLLGQFPGIEQIIPQDCIASYLGITPQSLSRIKRKNESS